MASNAVSIVKLISPDGFLSGLIISLWLRIGRHALKCLLLTFYRQVYTHRHKNKVQLVKCLLIFTE